MNQIGLRFRDADQHERGDDAVDLDRIVAGLRRQALPVALCLAAGLSLGVAYVATTPPTYIARATVLVETMGNRILEEVSAFDARIQSDAALLNEAEVIRSQQIAAVVVDRLDLTEDESFRNPPSSLASRIVGGARDAVRAVIPGRGSRPAAAPDEAEAAAATRSGAISSLQDSVIVDRIGRSYVFSLGFPAHDPALSAAITNAYAEAYVSDQLNANFDATERTTAWLQDRLSDLETEARLAARAVEEFRTEHGLSSSDGLLITERNLGQLNTELANAVAETARAEALLSQYSAVVEAGQTPGLTSRVLSLDSVNDERLGTIQERISALTSRLGQIEQDFGSDHPQANLVRGQLAAETEAAFREVERLAVKYAGDLATSSAREAALRLSVNRAMSQNSEAGALSVELRSLEQRADTLATLYQSYLTRFQEIEQQKSFPVSTVRILSAAEVPRGASAPSTVRSIAAGLVLGALAATLLALLRERRERFFRTGEDVTDGIGLAFLGYLPRIAGGTPRPRLIDRLMGQGPRRVGSSRTEPGRVEFHAVKHPRSHYAETLRNIRIAADGAGQGRKRRIIGVTSILPREGKTTLALNLAGLLASAGQQTLLIDADLRNPGLTRLARPRGGMGLVDAVVGNVDWRATRVQVGNPRLHLIPCSTQALVSHTSDLVGSQAMRALLEEARGEYNYVIVDLPPLGPVVDARVMLPHLDAVVMVAEWGRTPKALVRRLMATEPALAAKTVGMVLSKVDIDALPGYGPPDGSEQYFREYGAYHGSQG